MKLLYRNVGLTLWKIKNREESSLRLQDTLQNVQIQNNGVNCTN